MVSTAGIGRLKDDVTKALRSQITISSFVDAVREVLQNSVDAGAKNIEVNIDLETLSFLVKDDGGGISPNELGKVSELYFTSKIASLNDLKSLRSFGFRGEALHSISCVSNLCIISKRKDYRASFYTRVSNSKRFLDPKILEETSPYFDLRPGSNGTTVKVSNLFSNMPARLRQIQNTSHAKVLEDLRCIVLQCCVANSSLSIKVTKSVMASQSLICKVQSVYGQGISDRLLTCLDSIFGIRLRHNYQSIKAQFRNYKISGIISKLPVQTDRYQFVLWNRRYIKEKSLFKDIRHMFGSAGFGCQDEDLISSIPKNDTSPKKGKSPTKSSSVGNPYSKHPCFIIIIEGPLPAADLLQDPSKAIFISRQMDVLKPLVLKLLSSFLRMQHYTIPKANPGDTKSVSFPELEEMENGEHLTRSENLLFLNSNLRMGKLVPDEIKGMAIASNDDRSNHTPNISSFLRKRKRAKVNGCECLATIKSEIPESEKIILDRSLTKYQLKSCKVISQIGQKFILLKLSNPGSILYVVDQHACDERVRVERLLQDFIKRVQDPFDDLSLPLVKSQFHIELSTYEYELAGIYKSQCALWGIKYKLLEDNKIEITHIPDLLFSKVHDHNFFRKCLVQYLFDLQEKVKLISLSDNWWSCLQSIPTILIDLINSKACRSSIMFGKALTKNECIYMISELSNCKIPFQCAHGRPSIVPICDLSQFNGYNI